MFGDNIDLYFFREYLKTVGIEIFIPFKVYKKGDKASITGAETYLCLKTCSEASMISSHNWIRVS